VDQCHEPAVRDMVASAIQSQVHHGADPGEDREIDRVFVSTMDIQSFKFFTNLRKTCQKEITQKNEKVVSPSPGL